MQNEECRMQNKTATPRLLRISFCILHSAFCISLLSGCTLLSVIGAKIAPEQTIPPQYSGFKDQSIAIMVWADEGTMIDFPDVRADVAGSLQVKLQQAQQAK